MAVAGTGGAKQTALRGGHITRAKKVAARPCVSHDERHGEKEVRHAERERRVCLCHTRACGMRGVRVGVLCVCVCVGGGGCQLVQAAAAVVTLSSVRILDVIAPANNDKERGDARMSPRRGGSSDAPLKPTTTFWFCATAAGFPIVYARKGVGNATMTLRAVRMRTLEMATQADCTCCDTPPLRPSCRAAAQ